MHTYTFGPGEFLCIDGPASVRVLGGRLYVLGVEYEEGSSFTVMRGRRVVVKSLSEGKVEVVLGPEASFRKIDGSNEVIDVWDDITNRIMAKNAVIVVMGATDVGKTTMTTMIVNKGVKGGLKVGVIDGDPGQNDIGPPTSVSAAIAGSYITHLNQLKCLKSIFVKTTSVEHVWDNIVNAIERLVWDLREREGADLIVVNTDGWVSEEEAVKFKVELVRRVNADRVIVIKRDVEVDELIKALRGEFGEDRVIVAPSPPNTKIRDRVDRRIKREMGYSRYVMPTRDLSINLREKPIINLPLFRGIMYDREMLRLLRKSLGPISYVEQVNNVVFAISSSNEFQVKSIGGITVVILPQNWERGLLVALEDENNYLLALGVLKKIYYNTGKAIITVSKNFDKEHLIHHIRLGMIRLNENFEEVEKVLYIGKIENILEKGGVLPARV